MSVDRMEELFDDLWSAEYRISGDKPRAKEVARELLNRHAHLLAEKIRQEIRNATGSPEYHARWAEYIAVGDALAAHIDPEVARCMRATCYW